MFKRLTLAALLIALQLCLPLRASAAELPATEEQVQTIIIEDNDVPLDISDSDDISPAAYGAVIVFAVIGIISVVTVLVKKGRS